MPVAINSRIILGLRVVEMNCAHALRADVAFKRFDGGVEAVHLAHVVACGESMSGVEADAEVEFWTGFDDLAQMLEAMTDARALPGCVFQQDAKRAKRQTIASDTQTFGASLHTIRFTRAFRAARMHDQEVRAQLNSA